MKDLFDFSFKSFITERVVGALYILGVTLIITGAIAFEVMVLKQMSDRGFDRAEPMQWLMVVGSPVAALVGVLVARLTVELAIVLFRIESHLAAIRQR